MYYFEGESYKKKMEKEEGDSDKGILKIKRQKVVKGSYDIDGYYRDAFNTNTGQSTQKKKPKGWRALANGGYDH